MCKILIFGGTSEGRILAELCAANDIRAYVSTATDYGAARLTESHCVRVITGRKTAAETAEFIARNDIRLVLDATHPFAVEATENIQSACLKTGAEYVRVLRDASLKRADGIYFDVIPSLIEYLNSHDGNILLTTGSKELEKFRAVNDYSSRCTVRVLNADGIYEKCAAQGFNKIIAEQGPFSVGQNVAHLKAADARFLVTKDSGAAGGFDEKITAAGMLGAAALIIARPAETGISINEAVRLLEEYNGKTG